MKHSRSYSEHFATYFSSHSKIKKQEAVRSERLDGMNILSLMGCVSFVPLRGDSLSCSAWESKKFMAFTDQSLSYKSP
jgi:hypothetical protein